MPDDRRFDLVGELVQVGQEYRHLQQEHERKQAGSRARRVLEARMMEVGERFERLLSRWVPDQDLRAAWQGYLYRGKPPPQAPQVPAPPLFRGRTEAGALVEIRPCSDDGYDVVVDGTLESHETVPWHLDPDVIEPIQIGRYRCREVFEVPDEAVLELDAFLRTSGREPPWRWFRELYEDGLVDEELALTARGFRRLRGGASRGPPAAEGGGLTYGVLAVDGARARMFVLQSSSFGDPEMNPTDGVLREVSQTTHPGRRARDSELFADPRPGLRRGGIDGPQHGVTDRREGRRRINVQRFVTGVVEEAVQSWERHGVTRAVVVASPAILGFVRQAFGAHTAVVPWSIDEHPRDLSWLSAPALHDALAEAGLLPPRLRKPPLHPVPGLPL